MPRSSTYIGPPAIAPEGVATRYFTASRASEYFVAMPNTPVSHIHSSAPGPPAAIAVETPTMLPVPIVAASAVVSAANGDTSRGRRGRAGTTAGWPCDGEPRARRSMNAPVAIEFTI